MKPRPLWKVSVETPAEAEDAVAELLGRVFDQPASTYTSQETRKSVSTVFFEKRPVLSRRKRLALKDGLTFIHSCGLDIGRGRISVRQVRREDWAESWKRHFKPIEIGGALLIQPSWSRRRPRRGQAVMVLDPGLSFGTGQHPTTRFCLEQIVAFRRPGRRLRFLDMGTGSGILAIAAAKLGYGSILAFDFDVEALRVARENARQNGVQDRLALVRRELTRLPVESKRKYDLICANLTFDLLLAGRRHILSRLSPDGRLVLAGILRSQFREVRKAYRQAGLRLVERRQDGEWESGAFIFTP
jgi:ribosomal protein L11 methyltransferase